MKHIILIFLILFSHEVESQKQVKIVGHVLSAEDNSAVAYATIIDISSYERGTTSDENGKFSLAIKSKLNFPLKLKISCIGYHDTTITVIEKAKLKIILEKKNYSLPEVVIRSGSLSDHIIGIPDGAILTGRDGEQTGLFPSNSAGLSSGVFIKIPGNKMGVLKAIEYYLLPKGKPETPFMLRFLEPIEPVQANRMYSEDMFIDLLKEPIVTKGQSGWNTLSLLDYNIPVPQNDLFILFTPLEAGKGYSWIEAGEEWYGMVLGRYEKNQVRGLYWAIRAKDTYSYDDTSFRQKITPAIVLRYFSEK